MAVDMVACDAYGVCAEVLPERVQLDDWGYPILTPGPMSVDLLPHAQRAVRLCPRLALTLVPVPRD